MTQSIKIEMLPSEANTNVVDMKHITNMVNSVYRASETGLWTNGAVRTNVAEIEQFTASGEIAVAKSMEKIVGCVHIRQIDQKTGGFGLLAVDEAYQGMGLGRKLIRFAEQKYQRKTLHKMQLELLVPLEGSHPAKTILKNWYTRIGYHPVHTEPVEASFPELAEMLAIPCEFVVFQKELEWQ